MSTPAISAAGMHGARSRTHPKFAWGLGLALLICFACISALVMRAQMPDDAYIYLRIAQNVATRGEWAFNAAVPVNAATSPLYGLLVSVLVALHLPGLSTPLVLASALGLSFLAFAMFRGCAYLGLPAAFLLALIAISFPTLLFSLGLETPVYLACLALTALFVQERDEYAAGAAAGLTAIGRPEGGAIVLLAFGTLWWRSGRTPWKGFLISLVPVALWLLFCEHTFGTIVPHTMKIKAMQSTVEFWQGSWLTEFLKQLKALIFLAPLAVWGMVNAFRTYRQRPFLGLVIGFGVLQTVGYTVLHAPAMYFWYEAPGHLAYILAMVFGLIEALRWMTGSFAQSPRQLSAQMVVALTAVYLVVAAFWERKHAVPYRVSRDYIETGHWLQGHSAPGDWVAADEIGYLGVYSGLPIRDMLGLADPQSVHPLLQHRWDFWFTDAAEPRFIVMHNPAWVGEPGFASTPWSAAALAEFTKHYHRVDQAGIVEVLQHD